MKRIATLAGIVLGLIGGAIVVYLRILSAGFVGLDEKHNVRGVVAP